MSKLNLPLKIALISTGKKQYRLARKLKMSDTTLSRIVRGRREPTDEQRKAIAELLGRDASDIFPDHAA